ncbi:MAG: DUF1917 domain-containing protein [Elusimicrobia bacterium]|nr:DUF1917 domain-containing protein [Elusimicrobiota bacterium]
MTISERVPSQETGAYWIYTARRIGNYPEPTVRSGKWLIFVSRERIDAIWDRIRKATEEGRLGCSAKVATAKPNPNASDPARKVICVYSYDWEDKEDVMRIRAELRALGIVWKIPYKADADTDAGKYRTTGHTRISKYYE